MGKGFWKTFLSGWAAHRRLVLTMALLVATTGVILMMLREEQDQKPTRSAVPTKPALKPQPERAPRTRTPVLVGGANQVLEKVNVFPGKWQPVAWISGANQLLNTLKSFPNQLPSPAWTSRREALAFEEPERVVPNEFVSQRAFRRLKGGTPYPELAALRLLAGNAAVGELHNSDCVV